MKKANLKTAIKKIPAGFTFTEAMVSMLVLALLVGSLFTCLTFVSNAARRATTETEGNMRAIKTLELLSDYSYSMVETNYFPTEYVKDNLGNLVYAITTTITEVSSPTIHKKVTIDYTWCEGGVERHSRYYYVKPD